MNRQPIIAIDGPAGSGKTTVARLVAEKLGLRYIDSGAMYRAVTLKCLREGVPINRDDERRAAEMAASAKIQFVPGPNGQMILLDGENVDEAIRGHQVTLAVSPVSALSGVRKAMVALQRRMAAEGGVVMEGRDIGTVVFPDADLKVFLTASPEVRARRRHAELATNGVKADLAQLAREIQERDRQDSTRDDSPLRQAEDAVLLDTDPLTAEQVADRILELLREKT